MQNHENTHQYPMYPFPDGWVSGLSWAAAFLGDLPPAIDVSDPSKKLFAFFHIISIIPI